MTHAHRFFQPHTNATWKEIHGPQKHVCLLQHTPSGPKIFDVIGINAATFRRQDVPPGRIKLEKGETSDYLSRHTTCKYTPLAMDMREKKKLIAELQKSRDVRMAVL